MKIRSKYVLILGGFFLFNPIFAQVDTTDLLDQDNENQILLENIIEDQDLQEFDFDTEFERLETFRKNPLDINTCSKEQLISLGLLSELQIQALLGYRKRFGQILSLFELLHIPTFDEPSVRRILPYLILEEERQADLFSLSKAFKYSKNQIFTRYTRVLNQQAGYLSENGESPAYIGSPDKLYFRYRLTFKDKMSLGLTLEKDAGEEWLIPFSQNAKVKLPDYFSMHFYLKDVNKHIKGVALGDYQIFFGQGLVIWGGFGARKGANTTNIKRFSPSLRPYTSVNEAIFNRGAAVQLAFGKKSRWESTVFASHRFRDGNISLADTSDDASLEVLQISSLQEGGTHRTLSEIADKNSTQFISTGTQLKYKSEYWQLGAHFVMNYLTDSLSRTPQLYQKYQFQGQYNMMAGIDYSFVYKNLQFFGETALSHNGGLATLNGLLASLDDKNSLALLYRYFDPKFQSLTGNAFGETANVNNEHGFYLGWSSNWGKGITANAYFDIFSFPWLKSTADRPSQGFEYFVKIDYAPTYKWSMYLQFRQETKQANVSNNDTYTDYLQYNTRNNLRFHFRYRISRAFEMRTRAEMSFYKDEDFSYGMMLYQDLVWTPSFAPIKLNCRLAVYDATDYDTRIYAYENDVLYSFSVPAYYGRGMRFYINFNYNINRNVAIWLRYATTVYSDRNEISSGNELISGNQRSEIKAQIRVSF
jgi:hypothetical protein